MGGFHLFERGSKETSCDDQHISQENDSPLHPLLADDLMRNDLYSFAMPTEAEIKDALQGVKCRCGTHVSILKAVKRAAEMMG